MARRKYHDENQIDPQVVEKPTIDMNVLEIRGRGKKWHLFVPDPSNLQTSVPVIRDGQVITKVSSWVATNKMLEVHETFTSKEAAIEAAEFIKPGCTIKVIKTSDHSERAAKAAATRRKNKEKEE